MAYDPAAQDIALLKRTIFGIADFSGRSRRTEVIYFGIATTLAGIIFFAPLSLLLPRPAMNFISWAFQIVVTVPTFALFARRLHDQNRPTAMVGLYVIALALSVIRPLVQAPSDRFSNPIEILLLCYFIGVLVLWLWPGTNGPNQYGSDPREGGQ